MKRKTQLYNYSKKGNIHTYENVAMEYHNQYDSGLKDHNYLNAVIDTKNKTINIYGYYYETAFDRTFKIGDIVEYDSYNLTYTAPITAIGPKTITVVPYHGTQNETSPVRMDLYTFIWRNYNLDLDKISKTNQETSMYI